MQTADQTNTKGTNAKEKQTITIVGAGLCGTMTAILFAKQGFRVHVYEKRQHAELFADNGRSFNITLTERGLRTLRAADPALEQKVLAAGVKCPGRQVHAEDGDVFYTPYGKNADSFLLSISRISLNKILLKTMNEEPSIDVNYAHALVACDLLSNCLTFSTQDGQKVVVDASFTVAADGCWSKMRQQMMRQSHFEYSQSFNKMCYKELYMPAIDGEFAMPNYSDALNLWPRDKFMLLAMPNQDRSFSTSIFAPAAVLDALKTKEHVNDFFSQHFPDAFRFMPTVADDFFKNPTGTLVETRCFPYHFQDKVVLVGDAAHAMYPFMGQGTNCAFEDSLKLVQLVQKKMIEHKPIGQAMADFTTERKSNADALASMACGHSKTLASMRSAPISAVVTYALTAIFPDRFEPLYSSIAFSTKPYSKCIENENTKSELIAKSCTALHWALVIAVSVFLGTLLQNDA